MALPWLGAFSAPCKAGIKWGHETNLFTGLCWLRKGLAHGVSDDGQPDVAGNFLSQRSYQAVLGAVNCSARKLYLRTVESSFVGNDEHGETAKNQAMILAANCGIAAALYSLRTKQPNA